MVPSASQNLRYAVNPPLLFIVSYSGLSHSSVFHLLGWFNQNSLLSGAIGQ